MHTKIHWIYYTRVTGKNVPTSWINQKQKAIGEHFNLPGHSSSDFKCTIIKKVKSADPLYGSEREKIHIRKLNTFYNGVHSEP